MSVVHPSLSFYIRDNVFEGNEPLTRDNSKFFDPVVIDGKRQVETVPEAFAAPTVTSSQCPRSVCGGAAGGRSVLATT